MAKELRRGDIIQSADKRGNDTYSLILAGPFGNGAFLAVKLSTWKDFVACKEIEVYNRFTKQTEYANIFSMMTTTWAERAKAVVSTVDEGTMRRIAGAMYKVITGMYDYDPKGGYHLHDFSVSIPASMLFRFGAPDKLEHTETSDDKDLPFTYEGPAEIGNDGQIPDPAIINGPRSGGFDKSGAASTKALMPVPRPAPKAYPIQDPPKPEPSAEPAPKDPAAKPMTKKQMDLYNTRMARRKEREAQERKREEEARVKLEIFARKMEEMGDNQTARVNLVFKMFGIEDIPGYVALKSAYMSIRYLNPYLMKRHPGTIIVTKEEFLGILNRAISFSDGYEFTRINKTKSATNASQFMKLEMYCNTIYHGRDVSSRSKTIVGAHSQSTGGRREDSVPRTLAEKISDILSKSNRTIRSTKYIEELKQFCLENQEMIPVFAKGIDCDKWRNPLDLQLISVMALYPKIRYSKVAEILHEQLYHYSKEELAGICMMREHITSKGSITQDHRQACILRYLCVFLTWAKFYKWPVVKTEEEAKRLMAYNPILAKFDWIGLRIGVKNTVMLGEAIGMTRDTILALLCAEKERSEHMSCGQVVSNGMTKIIDFAVSQMLEDIELKKPVLTMDPSSPSLSKREKKKLRNAVRKGADVVQ